MTSETPSPLAVPSPYDAIVWTDGDQAVLVCHLADGKETVEVLKRRPVETATQFEARTVDEIANERRIIVSGSPEARIAFERTYVAITHRPDRLFELEPTVLK